MWYFRKISGEIKDAYDETNTVQSQFSDTFGLRKNCHQIGMILCCKLKNGLWKIVNKSQVSKARLQCTYLTRITYQY